MRCLYCHSVISEDVTLVSLFKKSEPLCLSCRQSLMLKLPGGRCSRCHQTMLEDIDICNDCHVLIDLYPQINKMYTLTDYNEEMKMLMHRYKFVKDYALSEVLAMLCNFNFKNYDVIVPVPISQERLQERTYNQTTSVLTALGIETTELLMTKKVKRQSERTKMERLNSENSFFLAEQVSKRDFTGMNIVIVDDIYTTGITIHQAAEVIGKLNFQNIDVLTFSKA